MWHRYTRETADTLEGNAHLKSEYIYNHYHMDCFADDTGLEIAALNNEPGVYSARYAGEDKSQANMEKVLRLMKDKPDRITQFRTAISLILDGKNTSLKESSAANNDRGRGEKQASATIPSLCPKVTTKPSQNWAAKWKTK